MDTTRRLWLGLAALLIASFGVLLWMGWDMHQQSPPMPAQVVTENGRVLYTKHDIETGRQVWQSIGGQQLGSIWGHGALVAPDWSADWLHREATAMLDLTDRSPANRSTRSSPKNERAARQSVVKARCGGIPTTRHAMPSSSANSAPWRWRKCPRITKVSSRTIRPRPSCASPTQCAMTPCPIPSIAARWVRSSSGHRGRR